jgi:hypothetical protein
MHDQDALLKAQGIAIIRGDVQSEFMAYAKTNIYGGWLHPEDDVMVLSNNENVHITFERIASENLDHPRYSRAPSAYRFSFGDGWIRFVFLREGRVIIPALEGTVSQLSKLSSKFWNHVLDEKRGMSIDMGLGPGSGSGLSLEYDPDPNAVYVAQGKYMKFVDMDRFKAFLKQRGLRV